LQRNYISCSLLYYIIVNQSFEEGVFPDDLKHATVSPVLKNADLDSENLFYHPISKTPYMAKVPEKAAFYQLDKHFRFNN